MGGIRGRRLSLLASVLGEPISSGYHFLTCSIISLSIASMKSRSVPGRMAIHSSAFAAVSDSRGSGATTLIHMDQPKAVQIDLLILIQMAILQMCLEKR